MNEPLSTHADLYPEAVILEVTNACNLRCLHCHFHGEGAPRRRPIGFMSPRLWRRVLDELAHWSRPVDLLTHGAGEPLLYPHLEDLLAHAVRLPHIKVGFMTNGMLLNAAWAEKLLDLQVDFLALSIDGVVPATHDAVRRNASLELIEHNVRHLIDRKRQTGSSKPSLSLNMVLYPHVVEQADDFVDRWLPYAETITLATFRPIGSRRLWPPSQQPPPFRPCALLWKQVVIAWDGRMGLCCEDIHLDVPVGSLDQESVLDVFRHGPDLVAHRAAHLRGDLTNLPLCRECDVWGAEIPLEEGHHLRGDISTFTVRTPAYRLFRPERIPPA